MKIAAKRSLISLAVFGGAPGSTPNTTVGLDPMVQLT
jgi:hypothetical protein